MNLSKLRNGALVHMAGLELGSSDTFLHRIKKWYTCIYSWSKY